MNVFRECLAEDDNSGLYVGADTVDNTIHTPIPFQVDNGALQLRQSIIKSWFGTERTNESFARIGDPNTYTRDIASYIKVSILYVGET